MIQWGKKRTIDLSTEIKSFAKDEPWSYVIEPDGDSGQYRHKLVFTERITEHLPNILFDAASNLRAALDQIAFAIAVKHTGMAEPKSAKFPFGSTEDDLGNNARGGCKDLPPAIRDLFVVFKPHEGGNDSLWALNKLANTPKHMALVPMFVGAGIIIGSRLRPPYTVIQKKWHRDRNEIVFMTSDYGGQFETEFRIAVAFNEIDQTIRAKHPVGVLNTMAGEVERVLMAAEAECRRIGLIS
jgi:hypothetical protein